MAFLSLFLIEPRTTCGGVALPTICWLLLHQWLVKMPPQTCLQEIQWKQFFHWNNTLFPDILGYLYQVWHTHKNLSSINFSKYSDIQLRLRFIWAIFHLSSLRLRSRIPSLWWWALQSVFLCIKFVGQMVTEMLLVRSWGLWFNHGSISTCEWTHFFALGFGSTIDCVGHGQYSLVLL